MQSAVPAGVEVCVLADLDRQVQRRLAERHEAVGHELVVVSEGRAAGREQRADGLADLVPAGRAECHQRVQRGLLEDVAPVTVHLRSVEKVPDRREVEDLVADRDPDPLLGLHSHHTENTSHTIQTMCFDLEEGVRLIPRFEDTTNTLYYKYDPYSISVR